MKRKSVRKAWKSWVNIFARFPCAEEDHAALDLDAKKSALKAASSVVCLKSYAGGKELFICSGIILESHSQLGTCTSNVLTSATLLRCMSGASKVADDITIDVYMIGGKFYKGEVCAVDFHYNIAVIKIDSDSPLGAATIRYLDNSVAIGLSSFQLIRHKDSSRFSLFPGEQVLALGRYFKEPYDAMFAPGKFRFGEGAQFDCKELLNASCKITKNGIGGPLINCFGEVIGVNFYDASYTPFLPINIASRCYEDLKKYGCLPRPWLGLEIIDLYAAKLEVLEKINDKFSHVIKGVMIKEVLSDSPAGRVGLCADDVIISCHGNPVSSYLELFEILWDKEGKPVVLAVVRASTGERLNLNVEAVKTNPKEYQWPVPEPRSVSSNPLLKVVI